MCHNDVSYCLLLKPKIIMKKIYLTVFCAMIANFVQAEKSTTKPEDDKNPLSFSGYVDTYYFLNSNKTRSNLGASGFERIFDQKANTFQVGLAQLKTTYTSGRVEGVMDLVFGNHADLGNYGNIVSPLGGSGTALAIKQAYIDFDLSDKFSITAGQFGTNVGYEVIDAPVNFNYSLSNLFGNGPFYHTGIKLNYAVSDKVGLMVGVNNGLDSKDDNNDGKGVMAQLFVSPTDGFNVYLNYFGSNEAEDGADKDVFSVLDLTTSYQITDKFLLGLNAASGSNATGKWAGAALYANGSLTEKFGLGARLEYFDNKSGAIYLTKGEDAAGNTVGVSVTSATLTGNVIISENLLFKPEVRFDSYSKATGVTQFVNKEGTGVDSQTTFGGALIFFF